MLKSDYDMNYLVLIYNEAKIWERSFEAGGSKPYIVENMHGFVDHVHRNAFVTS